MKGPRHLFRRSVTSSLRTQLMLVTVVPVVALLIVLTIVSAYAFTRLTQALVERRDAEIVQLAARQIASYWADSVQLLTQVASTDAVRGGDAEATQDLLSANVALQQRFDRISVTDAQGVVTATVGGEMGEQVGELSHFQRARRLRRPVRSRTYEDAQGRQLIAVAVPVFDLWGQFSGCMLGTWDLRGTQLGLPVASVRVGHRGFAYLVDEFGIILYHPVADLIAADTSQHPAVAALLGGEAGAQTVNVQGRKTVVGYAPIPLRRLANSLVADESWEGWGLLTSELWNDLVAPLRPYVRFMVVLLLLLVTFPLLILALNSQRIAAPLQSLVTQAERVASGEFDSQVTLDAGPSEVRELEMAFNKMVDQLREYQSDIQNYVVSILSSQEEERMRIGRDLHDETAQALIVLGRRIEIAQEMSDEQGLTEELEALRDMVDATLQGVRRFTRDLRPPLLEELGLPRTLEILGSRLDREESFQVDVAVVGKWRQLLPELELGLYRLAQEGLSNVRRHSHASQVKITLTYGTEAVELEIADDGVGFDAPADPSDLIRSGRLGLMGIHERARLFGGRATIRSLSGEGTTVHVVIPLSAIVLPSLR